MLSLRWHKVLENIKKCHKALSDMKSTWFEMKWYRHFVGITWSFMIMSNSSWAIEKGQWNKYYTSYDHLKYLLCRSNESSNTIFDVN